MNSLPSSKLPITPGTQKSVNSNLPSPSPKSHKIFTPDNKQNSKKRENFTHKFQ